MTQVVKSDKGETGRELLIRCKKKWNGVTSSSKVFMRKLTGKKMSSRKTFLGQTFFKNGFMLMKSIGFGYEKKFNNIFLELTS